jgi:hypothetical protein
MELAALQAREERRPGEELLGTDVVVGTHTATILPGPWFQRAPEARQMISLGRKPQDGVGFLN